MVHQNVLSTMVRQETHVWVSSVHHASDIVQAGDLVVPGDRAERSLSYIRTVKTSTRPQEAIEDPLLLGSLALLGAG